MFEPSEIEGIPLEIEKQFSQLEQRIMEDVIRRLKINGEITRSADWQINRLHELGESKRVIKKYIKDTLGLNTKEVNHLYKDIIRKGYERDRQLYKTKGNPIVPFEDNQELEQMIKAISSQTEETFTNITGTMGFVKKQNGKVVFNELSDYYQKTLDGAMLDISSGAFDYNTVLKRVVKEMTNSGLRTVDYASGKSLRIESAARTAVMTGMSQLTAKVNEDNAKVLDTEYFEVSWHGGARPSHQEWQGKVYSRKELETVCGLGDVAGLCGANCYHDYYPFIPGISERTYTDEQLEQMNREENTPKEFAGKQYTKYEALQRQRRLETTMRAQKQKISLLETGGADEDALTVAKVRYRTMSYEYTRFSKAMDLPQQRERVRVSGEFVPKVGAKRNGSVTADERLELLKNPLTFGRKSDIINTENKMTAETAVTYVHSVGKIDIEKYKCVTEDIRTDEVIITDRQIEHIKERHPNDYERFSQYFEKIVKYPDFIIEANKPSTALILKEIEINNEKFKTVLRLATSGDNPEYKNSIITFMKIDEKEWNRIIKNKKVLYKSE